MRKVLLPFFVTHGGGSIITLNRSGTWWEASG